MSPANPISGRRAGWWRLAAAGALALGLLATGCDPGDDGAETDVSLADDAGSDAARDVAVDPADADPDGGADPDAAPAPSSEGRMPELCVGCGAAASPRFRLIEHGLTPVESGPARAAASPRFRLILDP